MPESISTKFDKLSTQISKSAKDAPTRFDLYTLEDACKGLTDSINVLTQREYTTDSLEDSIETLADQIKTLNDLSDKVEKLADQVDDLRGAIDDLAKVVEKLPEQLK